MFTCRKCGDTLEDTEKMSLIQTKRNIDICVKCYENIVRNTRNKHLFYNFDENIEKQKRSNMVSNWIENNR